MIQNRNNQAIVSNFKQPKRVTHRKQVMRTFFLLPVMIAGLCFMLTSGGCSSSTTPAAGTSGASLSDYTIPTELSAVPTKEGVGDQSSLLNLSLKSALKAMTRAATDAGTDYSNAEARKYVEEHSLEQFNMLEVVLNAISQTNYTLEIDNDPYKAMVAFEDDQQGQDVKKLESWVCEVDAIQEDGEDVLRCRAWIEEQDEEGTSLIKAEFKVYTPPTKNEDGSYADYGVWTLNVKFDEVADDDFFAASASIGDDGLSIIKIHEKFPEMGGMAQNELVAECKAIMHRSTTEGYGKVQYPDWEALYGPDGDLNITEFPLINAIYAYDEDYLAVKNGDEDVVYKDRNTIYEMTHRYGVYNADTGDNVMKSKSFGFPIKWTTDAGLTKRAYYGAWQGRHQLWTQSGEATTEGTTVQREDFDPSATPETYTVGKTFNGVLVKRTYVDATLDDIKNIPVEIWIDNFYNLTYNQGNGKWEHCPEMDWDTGECATTPMDFDAEIGLVSLIVGANDYRKWVNINGWDQSAMTNKQFVYELAASGNVPSDGFYEGEITETDFGQRIILKNPVTPLNTTNVPQIWVSLGGSIYVQWNGTSWVEKELINFDQRTWSPEFGPNDKPFTLPENRELYINMQGSNYVVRKDGNGTTVKLELQTAVNPTNVASIVPDGTVFQDPWNPDLNSTYEFVTDPDDAKYLMLVYKTIGENDKIFDPETGESTNREGVAVGAIVSNVWGIETTYDGDSEPTAFNWEYSANGGWQSVTYLMNIDGTYKLLDDPVRFESITASNGAGDTKTLVLQFDGWMMGMPEMYQELEKSDWNMTEDISDKLINLPAGTELTEYPSGTLYLLKPLEVSQFLATITDITGLTLPDITLGESVDLGTVPNFVEHGMGDMPEVTTVKYSEGVLVE